MKVGAQPTMPFIPNEIIAPATNTYTSVGVREHACSPRVAMSSSAPCPSPPAGRRRRPHSAGLRRPSTEGCRPRGRVRPPRRTRRCRASNRRRRCGSRQPAPIAAPSPAAAPSSVPDELAAAARATPQLEAPPRYCADVTRATGGRVGSGEPGRRQGAEEAGHAHRDERDPPAVGASPAVPRARCRARRRAGCRRRECPWPRRAPCRGSSRPPARRPPGRTPPRRCRRRLGR